MVDNRKITHSSAPGWKEKLQEVIFGTETPAGKAFDLILLLSIILSVIIVFLDSDLELRKTYGRFFFMAEWVFTVLFTIEYFLRIIASKKPARYIFSFYGIIDLLAVLPTYLSLVLAGTQFLIVIRILRLLRIFRILKLNRYISASRYLGQSIKNSRYKIGVFLWSVLTLVVIMGAIMYLVEGPENGFRNIPESIYWAIVTMTTVGYGDISPHTILGKTIASVIMIIGYAIIAVPTGIISVEMARTARSVKENRECPECHLEEHEQDARYCRNCGSPLP